MNLEYKKVLYIDLNTLSHDFKIHEDLWKYVGGVGVGYRLFLDNLDQNPVILTCGPLSGYFPYISKACLLYLSDGSLEEKFGGGTIAGLLNMVGVDAIVFTGVTDKFVHISLFNQEVTITTEKEEDFERRYSDFVLTKDRATSQRYFSFGNGISLGDSFTGGLSVSIDSTESLDFSDFEHYEEIYNDLLDDYRKLSVEPRSNPSCLGCPMGCDRSSEGEDDSNVAVLPRCLISCAYAEEVFKSIPTAYACLNSVGYKYHHSHLENLPKLVGELKVEINNKLRNDSNR
jgi:aldehyde:ferredoxin oxidoreductase